MNPTQVKEPPPGRYGGQHIDWSLLSTQGRALFYIAFCPGCSVREIAQALGLTERAAWGIVRSLRQDGVISAQSVGRRRTYHINLDAPLFHPTISGLYLRDVLGKLVDKRGKSRSDQCLDISNSASRQDTEPPGR